MGSEAHKARGLSFSIHHIPTQISTSRLLNILTSQYSGNSTLEHFRITQTLDTGISTSWHSGISALWQLFLHIPTFGQQVHLISRQLDIWTAQHSIYGHYQKSTTCRSFVGLPKIESFDAKQLCFAAKGWQVHLLKPSHIFRGAGLTVNFDWLELGPC